MTSRTDAYTAPEWERSALITIDVQQATLDGQALEIPGTSAAVPAMRALRDAFLAAGRPVIHVVRIYRPDGSNVDLCRRRVVEQGADLLLAGSEGSQLAPGLCSERTSLDADLLLRGEAQPLADGEWAIYKPRWGAFYETRLEQQLRSQDVTTTVFCGCNFPNCPRTSVYEASERDFRVVVARDAVSGIYQRGEGELEGIGVHVIDSHVICDAVAPNAGVAARRQWRTGAAA